MKNSMLLDIQASMTVSLISLKQFLCLYFWTIFVLKGQFRRDPTFYLFPFPSCISGEDGKGREQRPSIHSLLTE